MIKDLISWTMLVGGGFLVFTVIIMESTSFSFWVNNKHHELGMIVVLGVGIASLYYAHSRIDSLHTQEKLDDIQDQVDSIQENMQELKSKIQKILNFLDDVKQERK